MSRAEVALGLARDNLGHQISSADSLQATTGVLYGVSTTLVGIMVAIVALKPHLPGWAWVPAAVLLACYVAATAVVVRKWRGQIWYVGVDVHEYVNLRGKDEDALWRVVKTILAAIESNHTLYAKRVWALRAAVVSLALETAALVAVAVAAWVAPPPP
jgi:hypothetical protein